MRITFESQAEYQAAATVLAQPALGILHELYPAESAIAVAEPVIGELLERLARHIPTVLLALGHSEDTWLMVGPERRELSHAFQHLARFVLPTYGLLPANLRMTTYSQFSEGLSPVHDAVRACFDGGYTFMSPVGHRATVVQKIGHWVQMEGVRPAMRIDRPPTYAELLARFDSNLAAMDWPGAEAVLAQLRQLHLITAENLAFLRVQLLAERGGWREIWEDSDFPLLAGMHVPRRVRSALISAFHSCVLIEPETAGNIQEAIDRFKQARGRLGVLLNGRFDLMDAPVVRVFGYQAVVAQDRTALDALLALESSDVVTRACLETLASLLPVEAAQPLPPAERLRLALRSGSYDAAAQAASEQDTSVDRALAWLRVAVRHPDAARMALSAYETLSPDERVELETADPASDFYLERILGSFHREVPEIRTWHAWFEHFVANPDDPTLEIALDELKESLDDRDWSPLLARTLARHIENLINQHEALLRRTIASRALESLVNQSLLDSGFPRSDGDYSAFYETLYTYMLYAVSPTAQNCAKLLRLVDAVLQAEPSRLGIIAQDLEEWLSSPKLALEGHVLAAFELLVEHGLTRGAFSGWYRTWAAHLLELPPSVSWDRASQQTWLAFGEWLQPGDDLLLPLRQRLRSIEARTEEDPLSRLPDGYRIGLFTLQQNSAERARDMLLERNPTLDIRLCHETDLSPQVMALAQHADLAVVVSTCITHAITYGIGPLLRREPIYPVSRGSSSIVRAVAEYAATLPT